ncbi:hypothetical protein V1514DRAFT_337148 [Lipomyces japonicus]|uniref:uncharacterized protein n=1 Tax=Lipomyces japonicus TaxID=56871 RepID=UPI0034CE77A9
MPLSAKTQNPALVNKKIPRSRNGCWTCRNRKIKCDEIHPKCTPCVRLGASCDYTRRVNFKDDTRRILSKMAAVTDTSGCPVYDASMNPIYQPYQPQLAHEYDVSHCDGFVVLCVADFDDVEKIDSILGKVSFTQNYYADDEDDENEEDDSLNVVNNAVKCESDQSHYSPLSADSSILIPLNYFFEDKLKPTGQNTAISGLVYDDTFCKSANNQGVSNLTDLPNNLNTWYSDSAFDGRYLASPRAMPALDSDISLNLWVLYNSSASSSPAYRRSSIASTGSEFSEQYDNYYDTSITAIHSIWDIYQNPNSLHSLDIARSCEQENISDIHGRGNYCATSMTGFAFNQNPFYCSSAQSFEPNQLYMQHYYSN